ncbi:MAG: carbon monoxide dehydrogenase [Acidobacteria bacterium]|nr:MAG: carbon monoxide dehydrogenase [Acidobacteriota bacterium]PYY03156.1 MAG: carbon monoxide dehydrogenase [Acidobacteriota bacterium]PYY23701.1 MAG: carbon monoxide dehydrogenase [Acidobacteriota bacterium]
MKSYLLRYQMRQARDLGEALEMVSSEPGEWKPFAGGTDLMVLLEQGKLAHRKNFVDLMRVRELRGIEVKSTHVTIGALTRYSELQRNAVLQSEFQLLCQAASETGSIANQNRGTLAGNIANASPAADSPPALLAYDAELELMSHRGVRRVPYSRFHTGYKQMDLASDEIISRIRLPRRNKQWRQHYRKVGTRKAQAISKVCFAGAAEVEDGKIRDIRVALGSVAPTVLRCLKTEALLLGGAGSSRIREAQEQLAAEMSPVDDFRSNAQYRTRVAQNLLAEFLLQL